jgi:catechol 2,3-dioxygenase-like lactoylglutathione lyase family enzyme
MMVVEDKVVTMHVLETIPVLRIFDVQKAREFYVEFLGFHVDWEHRFAANAPLYMQISRGACRLHLSEHHGDGCPGATVFVRVTGLEPFQHELAATDYAYMRPSIEMAPWNAKLMEVIDPFGNRLRFNESTEYRADT